MTEAFEAFDDVLWIVLFAQGQSVICSVYIYIYNNEYNIYYASISIKNKYIFFFLYI